MPSGSISRSSIRPRRINGLGDDAEFKFSDANLVSAKRLGSGQANVVYQMTYRMENGQTKDFVFKP